MIDDFVMGLTDRVVSIFGMEFFTEDEDQEMRGDFTDKLSRIGELVIYVLTHPILYFLLTIGFILVALELIVTALTGGGAKIAAETLGKTAISFLKAAILSGAMAMATCAVRDDEVDDPVMSFFENFFKSGRFTLGVLKIIRNAKKIYQEIKTITRLQLEKKREVLAEIFAFSVTVLGVFVILRSTFYDWTPPIALILFLWTFGLFASAYAIYRAKKSPGDKVSTALSIMEVLSYFGIAIIVGSFATLVPRLKEEVF